MVDNKKELLSEALEKLEHYRASRRLRDTPERKEVLKAVCKQEDIFTTQEVFVDMDDMNIHVTTVYNCMDFFVCAGIIERVASYSTERYYRLREYEEGNSKTREVC